MKLAEAPQPQLSRLTLPSFRGVNSYQNEEDKYQSRTPSMPAESRQFPSHVGA